MSMPSSSPVSPASMARRKASKPREEAWVKFTTAGRRAPRSRATSSRLAALSVPSGFSMKTPSPASAAASAWALRGPGGQAR